MPRAVEVGEGAHRVGAPRIRGAGQPRNSIGFRQPRLAAYAHFAERDKSVRMTFGGGLFIPFPRRAQIRHARFAIAQNIAGHDRAVRAAQFSGGLREAERLDKFPCIKGL